MALRVSGKNMSIGEALRDHVKSRIGLAVSKFSAGPISGHVTIEPEGSGFRADCTLHLDSGITLQVEAEAHEPYASFNRAADRIGERLRRYKRRMRPKHALEEAPLAVVMQKDDSAEPDGADVLDGMIAEYENPGPAVIAEPPAGLREMTVSSAVLELDLANCPVVIFRHAGDGRPNIVYRRADGNIGWIDKISI